MANEDNIELLTRDTGLLPLLVGLQDSSIEAVSAQAATCLDHIANIQTSFDVECEEPLFWGEYRVLDLVDSDDDSASSFEEALEVSDEQVELEEQQAMAANASIRVYQAEPSANCWERKWILLRYLALLADCYRRFSFTPLKLKLNSTSLQLFAENFAQQ